MITNELKTKIEKDLYEGMSLAASVYWRTAYNVVEKYIDEIDDDDDNFINEISMMTAVEFAKAKNEEYDKMIKTKEESQLGLFCFAKYSCSLMKQHKRKEKGLWIL